MTVKQLIGVALAAAGLLFAACGEEETDDGADTTSRIEHVHGLGVNPKDGALFIATHSGLFRSAEGSSSATPVGEERQDTMGFTVVGPDRFVGSGHPAPGEEDRPPNLGLIASTDGGRSWEGVSLAGEVDFHVLRYSDGTIYGVDALSGRLMVSDDDGATWEEQTPPGPVIDLAVDPEDPNRIIAATERGLGISEDAGESWRPLASQVGLLTWPSSDELFLVDAVGQVLGSSDGEDWRGLGQIGGQPAAFTAANGDELYAAKTDGTVMGSEDGGASWRVRSSQ